MVLLALSTPLIQILLRPLLEAVFPYPVDRFFSLWVFWIITVIVLVYSVRVEGIPLATFGITRNTRTLRYRLIEMIAALLVGLAVAIVLYLFSTGVRNLLGIPALTFLDPDKILPIWVTLPAWLTAIFTEELLFRSYAIERLSILTGKRWLAALISLITFVIFHALAWDLVHVLTVVLPAGLMITAVYLWRRSLWFVVVIHAVHNLPLVLLSLLAPYL
jgi:membrane protease YdiL (CAAX protease family)